MRACACVCEQVARRGASDRAGSCVGAAAAAAAAPTSLSALAARAEQEGKRELRGIKCGARRVCTGLRWISCKQAAREGARIGSASMTEEELPVEVSFDGTKKKKKKVRASAQPRAVASAQRTTATSAIGTSR